MLNEQHGGSKERGALTKRDGGAYKSYSDHDTHEKMKALENDIARRKEKYSYSKMRDLGTPSIRACKAFRDNPNSARNYKRYW
jgi:hypothetical protein